VTGTAAGQHTGGGDVGAAFVNVGGHTSTEIVIASRDDFCADLEDQISRKHDLWLDLVVTANHEAATSPGTLDVNGPLNNAYVLVVENGSDCEASVQGTATSGSLTIDSFGSTRSARS
jgi:hypothetical protein